MSFEAGDGLRDGLLLVRARFIDLLAGEVNGDVAAGERDVPVDGGLGDGGSADAVGRDELVFQHLLRVLAPAVCGGDDHALGKGVLAVLRIEGAAGFLEEGVEVGLLEVSGRLIELALDGDPAAVLAAAGYKVNAGIGLSVVVFPVDEASDVLVLFAHRRVIVEVIDHELLKGDAVLALRLVLAQLVEDVGEGRHGLYYGGY